MEKQQASLVLQEAKYLLGVFDVFLADVDLLADMHAMMSTIDLVLAGLLLELERYQGDELAEYMQSLEAVAYLDEVVDMDLVSDLEVQFFGALEESEESDPAKFLMQILERIELIYAQLVEKIHEFNALLEED